MTTRECHAWVLVGPTASGKSRIAQILAERMKRPIISADSMNIYRRMDLGTAKPSIQDRSTVQYYGIDLAQPTQAFSVGDWINAISPAFQPLKGQEHRTPILVGGTGLYVKCLLQGLDPFPTANALLRKQAEEMSLLEVQTELQKTEPAAYATLADPQNLRRLIRLLEKTKNQNAVASNAWKKEMPVVIGLYVERDILLQQIAMRVDDMYAKGLMEEARGLMELKLSTTAQHAIGYAEAFAILRGEMSEKKAKERTIIRTRQLAKKQMTWFRTQLNVEWIHTAHFSSHESLAEEVANVWKKVTVNL